MKVPVTIPAEEILAIEMSNSPVNQFQTKRKVRKPGSNPWTSYLIVGGVIAGAVIAAYYLSQPKQYNYSNKNKENGKAGEKN